MPTARLLKNKLALKLSKAGAAARDCDYQGVAARARGDDGWPSLALHSQTALFCRDWAHALAHCLAKRAVRAQAAAGCAPRGTKPAEQ